MAVSSKVAAAAPVAAGRVRGRRFKPIGRVFGSVSLQVAPDQVLVYQRGTGAPTAGSTRRGASAPGSSGSAIVSGPMSRFGVTRNSTRGELLAIPGALDAAAGGS